MPTILDLRAEYETAVKPAQDTIAKAQAENRPLSDEEKKNVKAALEAAKPIEQKILSYREDEGLQAQLADFGKSIQEPEKVERKTGLGSLGDQFVNSKQYKNLINGGGMTGSRWNSGPIELKTAGFKATLTSDAASGGDLISPDVRPGILPVLFRRLTVADLMPQSGTNSNTVRYMEETTATNAAATVAEGVAKPESTLIFDAKDEAVRKIATILTVTDEMLEDVEQIRGYIDGRLRLFVMLTEEAQLIAGDGTPPNISGILDRAIGTQALGADSRADAIFKAITKVSVDSFLDADGLVINPADWQDVRLEKGTDAQYYGPGPFDPQSGTNNIWGLRVVVTPAITAGTALVGAFATAAQVFRKSGITVEASNSHADNFAENLTTLRAEERLALAVYRPAAFVTVTGI